MDITYTHEEIFGVSVSKVMEVQDLTEESGIETKESIPSTENAENNKQVEWSELPPLPLEKIYTFLNREDRVNMSLVCRTWSEEFSSPSVWKIFRFDLVDSTASLDTCRQIKFAQKYSHMFRHVEIVCRRIPPQLIEVSQSHLKVFLEILASNSKLLSVKFQKLANFLNHFNPEIYDEMYRVIGNLLESQHHLQRVEFHDCFFQFQRSVELLKYIAENSKESLTHLVLRGFTHDERINQEPNLTAAQSLPALVNQRFPKLTTLETDYSTIFDSMFAGQSIYGLKKCQMRALSKIILHCEGVRHNRLQGLTSNTWKLLQQLMPGLKVDLFFIPGIRLQREIEFFIQPDMPISQLDYRLDRHHEPNMEMGGLFSHLDRCKVNDHLVSLYLVWMFPIQDLDTSFIPFIQACPNLRCLQLYTIHPVNSIDLLLRSWVEFPLPSLKEALISISNVRNRDDYISLITLADEFVPVLQVLGLNVLVIVDDLREQREQIEQAL